MKDKFIRNKIETISSELQGIQISNTNVSIFPSMLVIVNFYLLFRLTLRVFIYYIKIIMTQV